MFKNFLSAKSMCLVVVGTLTLLFSNTSPVFAWGYCLCGWKGTIADGLHKGKSGRYCINSWAWTKFGCDSWCASTGPGPTSLRDPQFFGQWYRESDAPDNPAEICNHWCKEDPSAICVTPPAGVQNYPPQKKPPKMSPQKQDHKNK
ncbi:MAG: hypothetical protein H0X26_05970 [Alphaproteobacteria bacterium]|nr:hypothetical protein [Alphaproteobacteria bacterium]